MHRHSTCNVKDIERVDDNYEPVGRGKIHDITASNDNEQWQTKLQPSRVPLEAQPRNMARGLQALSWPSDLSALPARIGFMRRLAVDVLTTGLSLRIP